MEPTEERGEIWETCGHILNLNCLLMFAHLSFLFNFSTFRLRIVSIVTGLKRTESNKQTHVNFSHLMINNKQRELLQIFRQFLREKLQEINLTIPKGNGNINYDKTGTTTKRTPKRKKTLY